MSQFFNGMTPTSLTLGDLVLNLVIACVCSLAQIGLYRLMYRGPGYSISFLNSLVMISLLTALVIMVIGDSLARAFGLVGAMSIIRFRTAVKETLDIAHIFFALAIGMTAGVGLYGAAIAGTIVVGAVYVLLVRFNVFMPSHEQYVVQVRYSPPAGHSASATPAYSEELERYCRRTKLVNVKSTGINGDVELAYYVTPRRPSEMTGLLRDLKKVDGVKSVVLFHDEEHF
jgi:uncharacterized membrane protein YhiD involved in acid resistance